MGDTSWRAGGSRAISVPRHAQRPEGTSDGLATYLREIGRLPLLLAEAERALVARMRLAPSQRQRDAARRELVERNLRLVVAVARGYHTHLTLFALEDLIQEGSLGLLHAADKFDPARGTRFSTYAIWWVHQAIRRALADRGTLIHVPLHMQTKRRRYRRLVDSDPAWRAAPLAEVAARLGLSLEEAELVRQPLLDPVSLDQPAPDLAWDPDAPHLGAMVADEQAPSVEELVLARVARDELLRWAAQRLTKRERLVLALRYDPDTLPARSPARPARPARPAPQRPPQPARNGTGTSVDEPTGTPTTQRVRATAKGAVLAELPLGALRSHEVVARLLHPPVSRETTRQIETAALRKLRRAAADPAGA